MNRAWVIVVRVILFAVLMFAIFSCRSKKKHTERIRENISVTESKDISEIKNNDVEIKTDVNIKDDFLKFDKDRSFELTQADSSRTITLITHDGKQISIKGANVKYGEKSKVEKGNTESNTTQTVKDKSQTSKKDKTTTEIDGSRKERSSIVDIKASSTWFVIIGLLVAVFIAFKYIHSRKIL